MSGHKIEDYTFALYNIMFADIEADDECYSLMCKDGKCICLDYEQAGLLRKLLSDEDQIAMFSKGERFYFRNLQSSLLIEGICEQISADKEIYCDVFFRNRFFPEYKEKLCQIITACGACHNNLMNVIKSIPTIYMTNSLHKIEERDSLIYLCIYSPCTERYISILLRAIICRTIGCCQRAENRESKESYVYELAKLLNRLAALLVRDDRKIVNQCINAVEEYNVIWENFQEDVGEALTRTISNGLQEYRKELEGYIEKRVDAYEEGRHNKLYCILKKILETADMSVTALPDFQFADFECEITDYDKVINLLDSVKSDAEKLDKIWSILSRIFWEGEDIPTDDLEQMERIAGGIE